MKQRFKINRQPYLDQFVESMKYTHIRFEGDMLVGFSDENVYTLIKASGLRTKNSRKVKKRFKKLVSQLLLDGVESYERRKTEMA